MLPRPRLWAKQTNEMMTNERQRQTRTVSSFILSTSQKLREATASGRNSITEQSRRSGSQTAVS